MGSRLGKFVYYSYNMEQSDKKEQDKNVSEASLSTGSGCGSASGSSSGQQSSHNYQHDKENQSTDDHSDGKNSNGSGDTTCISWRTRSENWSKKRRTFKGSSSTKKDFFGKRNKKWPMRKSKESTEPEPHPTGSLSCVCTMYRRTNSESESAPGPSVVVGSCSGSNEDTIQRLFTTTNRPSNPTGTHSRTPIIDLSRFNPADYPIDDEDERLRQQRAKEMAEGVEISSLLGAVSIREDYPAHSQVDFIHYLVPDLKEITNCSFYWGKIDRYEAEKLLDGKPEGTFLLRDSAQEEYLFSVSFRRYNRSLHARIEQWNNQFSFDSHDPSVYSSNTVTGLLEHYKGYASMFFEPMLTIPVHRSNAFSLRTLCRAACTINATYDSINALPIPKFLKMYLKEYHYKQRVRMIRLD